MFTPNFNAEKFRGLMLYAAHRARAAEDRWFGAVKLNKILYYSDFIAYRRLGRPITGATYRKLSEGPAPRELIRERQALVASEQAHVVATPVFNYVQHRLVPSANEVNPADYFADEEIAIIDEVIAEFAGMSGAEVSAMSHNEQGWVMANHGEAIPYETAWLDPLPVEAELELAEDDGEQS